MNLEEQIIEIDNEISSLINEQDSLLKNFKLEFPKNISHSLVGLRLKELGIETYYNSLEDKIKELDYKKELLVYEQINEISRLINKHHINLGFILDYAIPIKSVTRGDLQRSLNSVDSFVINNKTNYKKVIAYLFSNYKDECSVDRLKAQLLNEADFFSFQDVILINGKAHYENVIKYSIQCLKEIKMIDKKKQFTIIGKLLITKIQDLIASDNEYKNWVLNSGITMYEIISQLHQVLNQKQDDLVAAIVKCSGNDNIPDKLLEIEKFLFNDLHELAKKFEGC